jgi:2-(1,2-epoxy-1,2-dihydrophenyl)acetyl-CoA isomerase
MDARTIDTGTDHLLARIEDRVATLTLNRPERRNAFSNEMLAGLARALEVAETAHDVGCVVVTGAGGAFSAGGDVKGMNERNVGGGEGPGLDARIHAQRLSQRATAGRIHAMPKPVIAALPGAAAGAGFALAMACDFRVAAENAVLVTSFARVGFSGDYGGTYFATQVVGAARAKELYFLSDRVSAPDALRVGLVNRVVPAAELEQATRELALRLANGPTVAYRYMKENIHRAAAGADMLDCLDLEATHHVHTGLTEDHREAARAFVEKREPTFKGR